MLVAAFSILLSIGSKSDCACKPLFAIAIPESSIALLASLLDHAKAIPFLVLFIPELVAVLKIGTNCFIGCVIPPKAFTTPKVASLFTADKTTESSLSTFRLPLFISTYSLILWVIIDSDCSLTKISL